MAVQVSAQGRHKARHAVDADLRQLPLRSQEVGRAPAGLRSPQHVAQEPPLPIFGHLLWGWFADEALCGLLLAQVKHERQPGKLPRTLRVLLFHRRAHLKGGRRAPLRKLGRCHRGIQVEAGNGAGLLRSTPRQGGAGGVPAEGLDRGLARLPRGARDQHLGGRAERKGPSAGAAPLVVRFHVRVAQAQLVRVPQVLHLRVAVLCQVAVLLSVVVVVAVDGEFGGHEK
mmetsp:Transcript_71668/g.213908  ORF Transcript_71668/g.213908 Transcript_71668/m.213908 type:complete len:228 (+) Transcript_71668:2296-2979(+)